MLLVACCHIVVVHFRDFGGLPDFGKTNEYFDAPFLFGAPLQKKPNKHVEQCSERFDALLQVKVIRSNLRVDPTEVLGSFTETLMSRQEPMEVSHCWQLNQQVLVSVGVQSREYAQLLSSTCQGNCSVL